MPKASKWNVLCLCISIFQNKMLKCLVWNSLDQTLYWNLHCAAKDWFEYILFLQRSTDLQILSILQTPGIHDLSNSTWSLRIFHKLSKNLILCIFTKDYLASSFCHAVVTKYIVSTLIGWTVWKSGWGWYHIINPTRIFKPSTLWVYLVTAEWQ